MASMLQKVTNHSSTRGAVAFTIHAATPICEIPLDESILSINQSMLYYSVGQNVTEYIRKI